MICDGIAIVYQDIGPPAGSMDSRVNVRVPLNAIRIHTPDDGLPVIEDFLTTVISFIFSGSRLDREPLDLTFVSSRGEDTEPMDDSPYNPSLSVKKGFTRLPLACDVLSSLLSSLLCEFQWDWFWWLSLTAVEDRWAFSSPPCIRFGSSFWPGHEV